MNKAVRGRIKDGYSAMRESIKQLTTMAEWRAFYGLASGKSLAISNMEDAKMLAKGKNLWPQTTHATRGAFRKAGSKILRLAARVEENRRRTMINGMG